MEETMRKQDFGDMDRLLNVEEAAQLLGLSVSTIRAWRFRRILPAVEVGRSVRFRLSDLQRIMEKGLSLEK